MFLIFFFVVFLYIALVSEFHLMTFRSHRQLQEDPRYRESFEGAELKQWESQYSTLFFAGNGSSIAQASKYTGRNGVRGMTSRPAIRTLISPHLVENQDPFDVERGLMAYLLYPIYFLIHSWRGVRGLRPYWTNPLKVNLSQEDDLNFAVKRIEAALRCTEKDLILYGCSRGASVAISCLAYLPEKCRGRIKLVVAEAPFDSVEHVLETRFSPFVRSIVKFLFKLARYRASGPSPLTLVPALPREIPILIITSVKDEIVTHESSMTLYRALKEKIQQVHLITLKESSHSGYVSDNIDDLSHYYRELIEVYQKVL